MSLENEPRRIRPDELDKLINLYGFLHPGAEKSDDNALHHTWHEITTYQDRYIYFVIEADERLVSSCNISIIPNLTNESRPFAVIENVITHPDYRRRGFGIKVLEAAIQHAWQNGCYKIMLLSNNERVEAHRLYEKAGFNGSIKKGYVMKIE